MDNSTNNQNGTISPDEPVVNYDSFVASRVKDPKDIIAEMTLHKAEVNHYAVGVSTEAGELLDAAKKYVHYNKPLDRDNIIEELGDLEFYMSAMRQAIAVTREEVIQRNVHKLSKRYTRSFSNEEAQRRFDKEEEHALNEQLQTDYIKRQKRLHRESLESSLPST